MIYGYSLIEKYNFENLLAESIVDIFFNDEEPLDEGANIDMTKAFKDNTKEYMSHLKASKKAMRQKDYKTSIDEINKAKISVKKLEDTIKNTDASGKGSIAFGLLIGTAINFIQYFTISFGVYGATKTTSAVGKAIKKGEKLTKQQLKKNFIYAPWVGAIFGGISAIYKDIVEIKAKYNEAVLNGTSKAEAFNLYKTKLLVLINKFYKSIDKTVVKIIEHEKRDKAKAAKEAQKKNK